MGLIPSEDPTRVMRLIASENPSKVTSEKTLMGLIPSEDPTRVMRLIASEDPSKETSEETLMRLTAPRKPAKVTSPHEIDKDLLGSEEAASSVSTQNAAIWHRRLAHLNHASMKKLLGSQIPSLNCDICIIAKQTQKFDRTQQKRATKPYEFIHSDLCGPLKTSIGGASYYIVYIDDLTRYTEVCFLVTKNAPEIISKFKGFQAAIQNKGYSIQRFRCDNGGGEYNNTEFQKVLTDSGIRYEPAPAYTQHKNGVAERMIRTINTKARCMLLDAKLPMRFWAEAVRTAVYLHRRTPTAACSHMTPYEMLFGEKSPLQHLRRFGCIAYKFVPKEQRKDKKFGIRSRPCMMLGYVHDTTKIWRIWDFNRGLHGGAVECSNVVFREDQNGYSTPENDDDDVNFPTDDDDVSESDDNAVTHSRQAANAIIVEKANRGGSDEVDPISLRYEPDPTSLKEAMTSIHKASWIDAMKEEWKSLLDNHTFEFEATPKAIEIATPKAIGSRWVFRTKLNPDGTTKFKARLVIKGYEQVKGIDFNETYAPVSKLSTLRMLLAISAQKGWKIDHMDVKSAFLNPEIDNDNVYMSLPQGIEEVDPSLSSSTVRLRKALYGLKQAPKLWYDNINQFLLSLEFTQSTADPNLYITDKALLLLYVDDILIIHTKQHGSRGDEIKRQLNERYKMTDLGQVQRFLGLEIGRSSAGITLSQSTYIHSIIRRFDLENAKETASPMDANVDLDNPLCNDKQVSDTTLYQSMVGSLMYAALGTRPDIAFCVTVLSKYNVNPLQMHLTAAKRALRYLKKTSKYGLHFPSIEQHNTSIVGFTDSDWAGSTGSRKSIGGYVFQMNEGSISWQAKSQTVVALSTLEAEYIACSDATREAIWLRRLQAEIDRLGDPTKSTPTPISCDNQGALKLIATGVLKAKTKHIDIKFHHARDEQEKGHVKFDYIASEDNIADLLTKGLPTPRHQMLTSKLGLYEVEDTT
jgi:transposase InsO family protein